MGCSALFYSPTNSFVHQEQNCRPRTEKTRAGGSKSLAFGNKWKMAYIHQPSGCHLLLSLTWTSEIPLPSPNSTSLCCSTQWQLLNHTHVWEEGILTFAPSVVLVEIEPLCAYLQWEKTFCHRYWRKLSYHCKQLLQRGLVPFGTMPWSKDQKQTHTLQVIVLIWLPLGQIYVK